MNYLITGCNKNLGRNLIEQIGQLDSNAFFYLFSSSKDYTKAIFNDVSCLIFTNFLQLIEIKDIQLDYVIHLGENTPLMMKSWDQVNQIALLEASRQLNVDLREYLQSLETTPKRLLFASSVDYYGFTYTRHDREACINFKFGFSVNEGFFSSSTQTFACRYAQQSELYAWLMKSSGIETVIMRFGFVLDQKFTDLGDYVGLMDKFRMSSIGSGYQPLNWIHIDDAVSALLYLLSVDLRSTKDKVFNIVASTNKSDITHFGDLGFLVSFLRDRKYWFKLPESLALSVMGEKALKYTQTQHVYSRNLPHIGFEPKFKRLIDALYDLSYPK